MTIQNIKKTEEYKKRVELFRNNLNYLFRLIQKKRGDPTENISHKARVIGQTRDTLLNWLGRGQYDTFPSSATKLDLVMYRILAELGVANINIKGSCLYTINIREQYGSELEKAIDRAASLHVPPINRVSDPKVEFQTFNRQGLSEFQFDPIDQLILNPTEDEIKTLSAIQFPNNFPATKEVYKSLLLLYRRFLH